MRKIKEGIKAIRELGYNGPLVIHADDNVCMELGLELAGKLQAMTWSQGGIDTKVSSIDGVPIISTPANRMYTAITICDGKTTGQTSGGYVKGTSAKTINFAIMARQTPIAISKQENSIIRF